MDSIDSVNESNNQKRGSRRMESRRKQICDTAIQLFIKHGYAATKIEMIAEELGYSRASLYHYVKNKDELLALVSEDFMYRQLEQSRIVTLGDMGADERMEKFISAYIKFLCTPESMALKNPIGTIEKYYERFPSVLTAGEEYMNFVRGLIQQGVDEGTFHVANIKITATTLIGALNTIPNWFKPEGDLPLEYIIETATDVLIGGLMNPRNRRQ